MTIARGGIDRRSQMMIGAQQAVGHFVHVRLADKPRAASQQAVDGRRVQSGRRVARGEGGLAVARHEARDVDVFLDDEVQPAQWAAGAPRPIERDRQRAELVNRPAFSLHRRRASQ